MAAPFRVEQSWCNPGFWELYTTVPQRRIVGTFPSVGEAIDYAYKHWPWWP